MVAFMVPSARQVFLLVFENKRRCDPDKSTEEDASVHLYSARWPRPAELMFNSVTPEAGFTATLLFTSRLSIATSTLFNTKELATIRAQQRAVECGVPEAWGHQAWVKLVVSMAVFHDPQKGGMELMWPFLRKAAKTLLP